MAEFQEVMKQLSRMCESQERRCVKCPLITEYNCSNSCNYIIKKHPKDAEETIMKWAEEHPIKTNKDVFEEVLLEKFGFNESELDVSISSCGFISCNGRKCEECDYRDFWNKEYTEKEVTKQKYKNG